MIRPLLILAMLAAPVAASAQSPQFTLEQRMLLRCAAACALVAGRQANGEAGQFPDIGTRGREYFVRASAQVMDETGLGREAVAEALAAEARDLGTDETLVQVMPVCLTLLPPE